MTTTAPAGALAEGLAALGLALAPDQHARLLAYVALLARWNRAYNLTAVRDPLAMVRRHLLDSLAVLPYICGPRLLDVGTGAGLPGIPIAIARPDLDCVLLDGNGKKTRFCVQAGAELGIANAEVVRARAQDYRPGQRFDTVISRAFGDLAGFLSATRHLCAPGGRWVAMKGMRPAEPDGPWLRFQVRRLTVPGLEAERHAVIIGNTGGPELPVAAGQDP